MNEPQNVWVRKQQKGCANGGSIVKFHIDKVYEKHHKLSTDPKDYEDILEWLELPSDLGFDLTGVIQGKGKG